MPRIVPPYSLIPLTTSVGLLARYSGPNDSNYYMAAVSSNAGSNAITISGGAIDGASSLVISSNYGEALLVASAYGWSIIT